MRRRALVRPPSAAYARCIRQDASRTIDVPRALAQHAAYCEALRACGLEVSALPAEPEMPDACFVEDAAVVVGDVAVVTRPGAEARRAETASVERVLAKKCFCMRMERGSLDGGDVLAADGTVFVGLSQRTNEAGAQELGRLLKMPVRTIPVRRLLHLKTGITRVGERRLLQRAGAFRGSDFPGFEVLATDEPQGATVLTVDGHAVVSAAAPKTADRLRRLGLAVHAVDISEFHAGDAGVTCLSVIL
jgi:dimethylargininase